MTYVSWRRPLGLAALLLVLGTVVYWLEFSHKPRTEEKEEQAKKIFNLKDKAVASIKIVDGTKIYAFKCQDLEAKLCKPGDNSKWETTAPSKLRADDANVNSLLSTLNNLSSTETIDLGDETEKKKAALLKEYKLDATTRTAPESRRIEVTFFDGETSTLFIGEAHPLGDHLFALRTNGKAANENRVFLVPSHVKANFEHDLTYWRDKKLLAVNVPQIAGFELRGGKANLTAQKKEGQWTLQTSTAGKNEELAGDIENIEALLSSAVHLSAKGIAAEKKQDAQAKAALRGTKPVLNFSFQIQAANEKATPQTVTLTLFEKKSSDKTAKVYATVSNLDPLYEVEASIKDRLNKEVRDLRLSKLITSMERFTAKRLEFSGKPLGDKPLVLINTDSKWIRDSDKAEADAEKVQNFLDRISGNRIKDYLPKSAIPAGENTGITLVLGDDKTQKKRQITFWKQGNNLYARDLLSTRQEAFVVDKAISDVLPWEPDMFMTKEKK